MVLKSCSSSCSATTLQWAGAHWQMPPSASKASVRGCSVMHASHAYPKINWLRRTYQMSQGVKIIFSGVWDIHIRMYINPIVKNKINFINLFAATYHGWIRPFERLPLLTLTELIRPSDTDSYVSLICYVVVGEHLHNYLGSLWVNKTLQYY